MMLLLYITKPVPADYKRNNFVILRQLFSAALYIEMYILHNVFFLNSSNLIIKNKVFFSKKYLNFLSFASEVLNKS